VIKELIFKYDPHENYLRYLGSVPHSQMAEICENADIGIFASTCENLPNTLLEYMASRLPIASSNFGPMPEILQDGGVYFNPLRINEIMSAIDVYINFPEQREEKSWRGFNLSKKYSWKLCAKETFDYLHAIVSDLKGL
jgi:glycosyltransferase involved in cell wall biosynthesis